jgi:hypothetical protein
MNYKKKYVDTSLRTALGTTCGVVWDSEQELEWIVL